MGRYLINKYLRRDPAASDVEWGYAFDVHINAFFPPLSLLHCFQIVLFNNLLMEGGFISCVVANTFWLASVIYYLYITFLGYSRHLTNPLWIAPIPPYALFIEGAFAQGRWIRMG
ncbi:unnamed protein product, partial [Iphiclides podalirius]